MAGKVVAGDLQRYAAERHLRDLRDGVRRGLHFDVARAERAISFFPAMLSITAGMKEGRAFDLLPWHLFVVGSLFGWRKETGRMRFRSAWLETGKGQAKSPLMAAIGLYLMGWYGIQRSEIYSMGQDRRTANVLFSDAVAMCRAAMPDQDDIDELARETLESRGEVVIRGELGNAWKIEHPATSSLFQTLANGEAISGPRPTAVLADEIHEFKHVDAIETWKRAIGKMPGDAIMLLGTNTPSTTQIVATELSAFYQAVAKAESMDDEAFSFIARVDKADDPFTDETCWPKSLPALGITFPIENVRGEVNTARILTSTERSVKRLYFGIPIGTTDFWIAEDAWAAVQAPIEPAVLKGRKCWLSLDLSKKNDLTALSTAWDGQKDDEPHLFVKTSYWTTRDRLADRARADKAPYVEWVDKGFIEAVPGPVIDYTFVAAEVQRRCLEYDVQFLAFDVAFIGEFLAACKEIGFSAWKWEGPDKPEGVGLKLVPHAQGKRIIFAEKQLCMPTSITRLEDRILQKTITIEASPVTYSCAANAVADGDGQGNRFFDKERSRGRIDGIVTIAMVVGAATMNDEAAAPSVYETRGLLEIEV